MSNTTTDPTAFEVTAHFHNRDGKNVGPSFFSVKGLDRATEAEAQADLDGLPKMLKAHVTRCTVPVDGSYANGSTVVWYVTSTNNVLAPRAGNPANETAVKRYRRWVQDDRTTFVEAYATNAYATQEEFEAALDAYLANT